MVILITKQYLSLLFFIGYFPYYFRSILLNAKIKVPFYSRCHIFDDFKYKYKKIPYTQVSLIFMDIDYAAETTDLFS